jgi:hypothetical protein
MEIYVTIDGDGVEISHLLFFTAEGGSGAALPHDTAQ